MTPDEVSLREILDATSQLLSLLEETDAQSRLETDRIFRHSVFFEFVVIGEQAGKLSPDIQSRHPEVPWRPIIAFRHRVAHGYFELSLAMVWEIWKNQIPDLHRQLTAILEKEFPSPAHGQTD